MWDLTNKQQGFPLDISLFNYFHPLSLKVSAEHQSAVIQTPVGRPGLSPFHLMCSVTEYVSRVCVHARLTTDVVVSVHMNGIEGKLRAFAAGIQWMCWIFFVFCFFFLPGRTGRQRAGMMEEQRAGLLMHIWSWPLKSGGEWNFLRTWRGRKGHMPVICHNAAKCAGHAKSTGMPLTHPEYASGLEWGSLFSGNILAFIFFCPFACMLARESQRRTLVTLLNCCKELLTWLMSDYRHGQHIYTKHYNAGIIIVKMFALLAMHFSATVYPLAEITVLFTSHKCVCSSVFSLHPM